MEHLHHYHQNHTQNDNAQNHTTEKKKDVHEHHDISPSMGDEGHDHHAVMIGDFKKRFWISLILTIPVLLLSEMIQHWLAFEINFPVINMCF